MDVDDGEGIELQPVCDHDGDDSVEKSSLIPAEETLSSSLKKDRLVYHSQRNRETSVLCRVGLFILVTEVSLIVLQFKFVESHFFL